MLDALHKVTEMLRPAQLSFIMLTAFLTYKVMDEARKDDETPGDNFPYIFMR